MCLYDPLFFLSVWFPLPSPFSLPSVCWTSYLIWNHLFQVHIVSLSFSICITTNKECRDFSDCIKILFQILSSRFSDFLVYIDHSFPPSPLIGSLFFSWHSELSIFFFLKKNSGKGEDVERDYEDNCRAILSKCTY